MCLITEDTIKGKTSVAVSYTHLDVYKRQRLHKYHNIEMLQLLFSNELVRRLIQNEVI